MFLEKAVFKIFPMGLFLNVKFQEKLLSYFCYFPKIVKTYIDDVILAFPEL